MNEQFAYFTGTTRKQLPSFGDEILILFFDSAFKSLNDSLFICVFRLDYASVLAVNGMIPQTLLRGALDNPRVTMDLMFVKG